MGTEEKPPESLNVRLNFRVPGRMPSVYAHHVLIQPAEHEVLISFFEIVPPLAIGDSEDQLKLLQETGVIAECVARITLAKSRYAGFAAAVQQILNLITSEQTEETVNADANRSDNQST